METLLLPIIQMEIEMDPRKEMQDVANRDLTFHQQKRISYPYTAPLVFDCRFNGAGEQIVQGEYQAFINCFREIA